MKSGTMVVVCFLIVLPLLTAALAQKPAPRSQPADDISGMYTFLKEGEFVQVTVEERGKVTGFVSRYGELASDQGAFLDQFFKTGELQGDKLTFTTEAVHGVWYEFRGTVDRGPGKTPADEAYRVLKGKLTEYLSDSEGRPSARSREVVFKSFPEDAYLDHPKRD